MGTTIKVGAIALVTVGLGACAPVAHNYGEAVAYTKTAQIIDPTPTYDEDDAKPGDSGERAASAAEAHRTGSVQAGGQQGGSGGLSGGGGGLGGAIGPR